MARTALTTQIISKAGITPSFVAATVDGHSFTNPGNVFVEVKNTGATPCDVTIQTPAKYGGMDVAELVVTVPITTGDKMIGPFAPEVFNQGSEVYINYSVQASVTVAVFQLPV